MSNASTGTTEAEYQVRLDVFEGPLDLLLYLVRKEEVELYDLSLERLIQQYLDYLGAVPQPDLDRAGDFIAMAAHLIYLKSRRLLPPDQQPPGTEEGEEIDPRWELIRQLVEYKKFKDVAAHLQTVETSRLDRFTRLAMPAPEFDGGEEGAAGAWSLGDIGVFDLLKAFQKTLHRFEAKTADTRTVIFEESFTVADKIQALRDLMAQSRGQGLTFSELFARSTSRLEMVVTFLALLELVRLRQLRVRQAAAFEEVTIFQSEAGSPPGVV